MSDQAPKEADATVRDTARDEMVRQVVGTLSYVAVMAGLSWCIANRDMLWRARQRAMLAWRNRKADPYARQVAEFRREISDLSRGTAGPDTSRARGLYEHG